MKIHVLTAAWKRPEITRICFEGIKRLGFQATVAISEESMISLCDEYGFDYVMVSNNLLGRKWNYGLRKAKEHNFDYLMILGSDNIVSDCLIDKYMKHEGVDMIGVKDLYIFDSVSKKTKHFEGYSDEMSIGAGRLISRKVINSVDKLWGNWLKKGLDTNCSAKIKKSGFTEKVIKLNGSVVLDIKSDTNIHSFNEFDTDNVPDSVLSKLPEKDLLFNL